MSSNFILGLDIGTANVKAALAEKKNGRPVLRDILREPSSGLRKGVIVDMPDALPAVTRVLEAAKKISKAAVKNIYVNIGTHQVKVQSSRGFTAVSRADNEIYEEDIRRVVKASEQSAALGPNRIIAHNVTREFIVDGVPDIGNPLGLSGTRLEVSSLIVDAFEPHIKSLMRVVELAGGRIAGLVMSPIAGGRSALSKSQKDLGAALIGIGCGTTGLCVYEENKLLGAATFPVGAGNITSDLAVGLKIPVAAAEDLKLNYGYAIADEVSSKETIDLKKFHRDADGTVSRRFVVEIIEARLTEVLQFVSDELKLIGKEHSLAGGAVLTGGGAKLPGLTGLAKEELKLSSQIGLVADDGWLHGDKVMEEFLEDPEFVDAVGLLLWGADEEGWRAPLPGASSGLRVRNLLKYFIP